MQTLLSIDGNKYKLCKNRYWTSQCNHGYVVVWMLAKFWVFKRTHLVWYIHIWNWRSVIDIYNVESNFIVEPHHFCHCKFFLTELNSNKIEMILFLYQVGYEVNMIPNTNASILAQVHQFGLKGRRVISFQIS